MSIECGDMSLKEIEKERYSRQVLLNEIGEHGQKKLLESSALVIGCGALGGIIANNLARAGVGHLIIVDRDIIELNNLQRQTLFDENDIGSPKAFSAANRLRRVNSEIRIDGHIDDVNSRNVEKYVRSCDIVVDGTDNMFTRFLANDACVKNGVPWIYGGAVGTHGMTMNIIPKKTACFRCIAPNLPPRGTMPTCDTVGVLNAITTIIAAIQSNEALKILTGKPSSTSLISIDIWNHEYKVLKITMNKSCMCCSKGQYSYLEGEKEDVVTTLCGSNSIQISPQHNPNFSFQRMSERLRKISDTKVTDQFVTFGADQYRITVFKNGRAIIKGTTDEKIARSLYAKFVGT